MTALALTEHGPVKAEDWRSLLASRLVAHHDPIYPSERHFLANMDWRQVKPHVEKLDKTLAAEQDPATKEHRRAIYQALCLAAKTADQIVQLKEEEDDMAKTAKKAAKKAAKKIKTPGETRGRRSTYGDDSIISVKVDKNPKRAGTPGHASFALYKDGMTVKQFRDKGGRSVDLNYDVKHKFISVSAG